MKTIWLIRHGETEANREERFRGREEIPLSPAGITQAGELQRRLADLPPPLVVYSSPLGRARRTAELAFPHIPPRIDERIHNLDLGRWGGRPKAAIAAAEPEAWRRWITEPETMTFPGGESLPDLYARVVEFAAELAGPAPERVAVVSHRSVLKALLAVCMGLRERYFWKFHLDNASLSEVIFTPERGFTLRRLNDTTHLSHSCFEWN